ncbi:MAG: DUF2961 domain-containing protein [Pseudonocardiaceae bacterium]|nr:DUF2961 domain-containing protein [Pseudonocardiaceae bacterium]
MPSSLRAIPLAALLLAVLLTYSVAASAQPTGPEEPREPSSGNPGASADNSGLPPTLFRPPLLQRPGPTAPTVPPPPAPSLAPVSGKGPVGYEHYRRLDALAALPTGVQTRQFSSFDRTGGNDDGFTGAFSCLRIDLDGCVIAEHQGAGEVGSIWFTRDGGDVRRTGNIKIELDGRTVLDAPLQDVVDGRLGAPFVYPLVANADLSSGGVYIKVPMPFRESMRITTQYNPFFYHVTYRAFGDAAGVDTFDPAQPAHDVIDTLRDAGFRDPKPAQPDAERIGARFGPLAPGDSVELAHVTGPGSISELRLRIPQIVPNDRVSDEIFGGTRLRLTFDGVRTVDVPLADFLGSGLGEYEVRSLFSAVETGPGGWYTSWWPMPYAVGATVELVNGSPHPISGGEVSVAHAPSSQWALALSPFGDAGYFGVQWHRGRTTPGQDWVFSEQLGRGKFLGVASTMIGLTPGDNSAFNNIRGYLEGDERAIVDDVRVGFHGTGTEDYFEGGWYFNRGTFSNAQNGNTAHELRRPDCPFSCDSAYRFMIADAIPYQVRLLFGMEHGPLNDMPAIYSTTAFHYAKRPVP